jgi:hypothetical protein
MKISTSKPTVQQAKVILLSVVFVILAGQNVLLNRNLLETRVALQQAQQGQSSFDLIPVEGCSGTGSHC